MVSSKKYFETTMIYDDDTIRLLFRTEYYVYEKLKLLLRVLAALLLVSLSLFWELPTIVKFLCLPIGVWLFIARDFPSKVRAEGVIQNRGGAQSEVNYYFNQGGIYVKGGINLRYENVDRIIEDDHYYYIFENRQFAVMVPKERITPDAAMFKSFIEKKTNREVKRITSLLGINLKELIAMIKDQKMNKAKQVL